MRRLLLGFALVASMGVPAPVRADGSVRLIDGARALRAACRRAQRPGPRALYAVEVEAGRWSFGSYSRQEGLLPVDTRRNLRVFRGAAELFASRLETIGFVADRERASVLVTSANQGARLRIGFFLGFDGQGRSICLVRAFGVTSVRMDVAFVELLASDGSVLAREDTERLRAWLDDQGGASIPGEGPRGAAARPTVDSGVLPESWVRALAREGSARLGRAFAACHAAGVARGAAGEGEVAVRLEVDPRSGVVVRSDVELSTLGDAPEASCIARALSPIRFPAVVGPTPRPLVLRVPVHLAN